MPTCGLGTWSGPLPGDPGDISGLAAVPVFGGVQVSWNLPAVNPHALAYVTIFRGTSAAFGSAIQIATAGGDSYLDRVNSGTTYYYWAGSVSINGTQGALLGPVFAIAKPLIQDLLEELSGEIDRSSLGVDLKGELDRITLTEQELAAEVDARLAANAAYQSLLQDLDAGVTGGLAAVNQEILLRESEDSALAGEISSFASILVDPVTGLMATRATLAADYYTKVGVDDAIATSTLTMVSQANLNAAVDAAVDDAMVGVLDDYPTTAMLTAGYFTKAETNSAISGAIADYDASAGGSAAAINSAILTRVGYSALASNSTTPYDGDGTTIIYPVATYPTIDYPEYALNRYRVIDDLGVDLWNATGPGMAKPLVWVPGLPMASAITQFGVTDAAGNSATLSQAFLTQKTLNDGLKGQYTVKLDVNGRVSGFGIYSDAVGSAAIFNVDKFAIGNVGAGTIYPFMVDTGVVYMNESVIQKLTFGKLTDAGGLFVVADGKIKTDYIETKGLTIKDMSGNVIFGVSQNLDFDRIGGSNKPANGATVGAPAGTLVNGIPVATITTAVSNFNSANDRNTTAVVVPGIPTGGVAIDHVLQDNGSADISFEWTWAGTEGDIDGFIIYVRQSTSAWAYTLGTTPGEETAYVVPANKRAFVLYGALPNAYYTFGVRAYRKTDASVAGGLVQSTISQSGVAGENPYRPSTSIAFNGAISGTVDGEPLTTIAANATTGAAAAGVAAAAQEDADAALLLLTDIASDSKLTPSEKQAVKREWDAIVAEKSNLNGSATYHGVTTENTDYNSHYALLNAYLNTATLFENGAGTVSAGNALLSNLTTTSDLNKTYTSGSAFTFGAGFRKAFENFYNFRQSLLNRIAVQAGLTAQWSSVSGADKPRHFTVSSVGYLATTRLSWGLYEGATIVQKTDYFWNFVRLSRSTLAVLSTEYLHTTDRSATVLAWLNAFTTDHILVVYTNDHPMGATVSQALLDKLYTFGASKSKLGSAAFLSTYRAAYAFVGAKTLGEGAGLEMISLVSSRALELGFSVQNGTISGSTGTEFKIDTGNVSTYIDSAAIGSLDILTTGKIRSGKTAYGDAGGTGWLIEYNGGTPRFDIGSSSAYLRWTGSGVEVSGATITSAMINSPSFDSFTATISGAGTTSVASGAIASRNATVTPSGGKAPYAYSWNMSIVDQYGTIQQIGSSGANSPTFTAFLKADPGRAFVAVSCVITDANGRTVTKTAVHDLTCGSPPIP